MSFNLTTVFNSLDFKKLNESIEDIVSLSFKTNKKNGARMAIAVLGNGATVIKTVTPSGAILEEAIKLPQITTKEQRNRVIKELATGKKTQEQIAAMLDISQATVSNVLRKK